MSKHIKISLGSLIMAAIFWFTLMVINPPNLELVFALAAIACSLMFVSFLVVGIFQKLSQKSSPYRVFAVVNGLAGAAVLTYAIYDIQTDTGWFAGLVGVLLLLFVIPLIFVLLLADFIIWRRNKSKKAQ